MNLPRLTIVTAASSNHFQCLLNLLWSIGKFAPYANLVVYDLGLTADEAKQIPNIRKFDYSKYPEYFNIHVNAGRMGFRPTVIQSAANEFGGIVLWLDAGCLLTESVFDIIRCTQRNGVYCPITSGTIETALHPNARTSLNVTEDLLPLQLRDAGVSSFDTSNVKAKTLIDKWATVALDKNATCPDGSKRMNHRQDAVFTVLLNQSELPLDNYRSNCIAMRQDKLPLKEVIRRYDIYKGYA